METIKMTQKEIAVACLEKLGIYKPYITKFKSAKGTPCFFENYGGFWADQEPELFNKIKEVEKEYGCLVYAVTHEITNIGETWSMLCVSKYDNCIEDTLNIADNSHSFFYAFAYVWNKTDDYCSEFGDIMVTCRGGGIRRNG